MGRLNHDPHIQHWSHPHLLELTNPQTVNTTPCSACKLQPSGWMYTCYPCNFTLHLSCTQMPQLIIHPSHSTHSLSLLPIPIYTGGLFNCDACGRQGHGFSYHCTYCDFDLHILCASKPLTITHQTHSHQLTLTFDPPYQTKGFSCDICRKLGSNHWLYRCSLCEFDAHLDCAANVQPQPQPQAQQIPIQHYNSFPEANQMQYGNGPRGLYVHSQSMGALPTQNNYPAPAVPGRNNPLMDALVQGVVQGAAEQAGQNIVQSFMNNGGNGGSGSNSDLGNNGGDPSIIDLGSSIVNGIFGDSGSQN